MVTLVTIGSILSLLYFQNQNIGRKDLDSIKKALLTDRGGKVIELSEVQGVVTLVAFWATWCGACKVELPTIAKLYEKLKNRGLRIVAVNVGETISKEEIDKVWVSLKIPFDYYMDYKNKTSEFFNISALPTNIVLDKYNKQILTSNGANDWSHARYVDMIGDLLIE